jgi:cytochrome c oxidase cbb3-type subunit 3
VKGKGGVGIPLSLPAFLQSASDNYLISTIRHGRPGRVMPAFNILSDAQVNALVSYIRSWLPGDAPVYSGAHIEGDKAQGKVLYAERCATCHGENGEGGLGTGITFSRPRNQPIMAPALRNEGFLVSAPDQMIKDTLMHGRKGTPMSSYLKMGLKEQDIDNIVAYVRSFEAELAKEREKLAADSVAMRENGMAVLKYESPYPFEETLKNVENAAVAANFRLIRTQDFEEGMVESGQEDKTKRMVYFCNFRVVDQALAIDPRVGLFLPCRINVVEQDDKVFVMAVNPRILSGHFNNTELDRVCEQMTITYEEIMEEATL